MATLKDRLTASIAVQQAELLRIQQTADEQTAKVRAKLMLLQNFHDALSPQLEALLTAGEAGGIEVIFKER